MTQQAPTYPDPWLALPLIELILPFLAITGTSAVARGATPSKQTSEGFIEAYRACDGDPTRMAERMATSKQTWAERRAAFVARHVVQLGNDKASTGFVDGQPSSRLLALLAWAYVPPRAEADFAAWLDDILGRAQGAMDYIGTGGLGGEDIAPKRRKRNPGAVPVDLADLTPDAQATLLHLLSYGGADADALRINTPAYNTTIPGLADLGLVQIYETFEPNERPGQRGSLVKVDETAYRAGLTPAGLATARRIQSAANRAHKAAIRKAEREEADRFGPAPKVQQLGMFGQNVHKNPDRNYRVQSVVFDRAKWSIAQAQKWLRAQGYDGLMAHLEVNTIRFRQEDPRRFLGDSFRTGPTSAEGIQLVGAIPKTNGR